MAAKKPKGPKPKRAKRQAKNLEGEKHTLVTPTYPKNSRFAFEDYKYTHTAYEIPLHRDVRIYCDGIYDLFHYGHSRSLEQAKNLFPNVFLIVGVCSDELTKKMKGQTVMTMEERAESLRHCKWVDQIIEDAPWVVNNSFLKRNKIDYVAHDAVPYSSSDSHDVYDELKRLNKFIPTMRTGGISTSSIITKILRSYDLFIKRNLERGVTAKELNISYFTEGKIKVENRMTKIKQTLEGSRLKEEVKRGMKEFMEIWDKLSIDFVQSFSRLFERRVEPDDSFSTIWEKITEMVSFKKPACH